MAWDIFALEVALVVSFLLRESIKAMFHDSLFWTLVIVLPFVDLSIMVVTNVYRGVIRRDTYHELVCMMKHAVYLALFFSVFLLLMRSTVKISGFVFVVSMLLYMLLCFLIRLAWKDYLQRRLHIKNHTGLLVVAELNRLREVVTTLVNHNYNSYRFVGVALMDEGVSPSQGEWALKNIMQGNHEMGHLQIVASRDELMNYLVNNWVDEVYLDIPDGKEMPIDLVNNIMTMGITVHLSINNIDRIEARSKGIEWICGQAVITASLGYVSGRDLFLKRLMDIAGGLVGSLITMLVTLFLAPMIYIASPGPIFFHQTRIGENGRKFEMYKFRSMYMDAEERKKALMKETGQENELMFKMEHDPRIIGMKQKKDGTWKKGIGGWIRDLSIDELPQFFNILKGDMSLVGTRPPTVDEWERYEPYHRGRMSTKPGLTGMWQVSGRSKIRDFDQVVQLDREYIENWSLRLDFQILVRTVWVVLTRRGAM